jgi:hypothetical protein
MSEQDISGSYSKLLKIIKIVEEHTVSSNVVTCKMAHG